MQVGELFLEDGAGVPELAGEPGDEEKGKIITEESFVFPDSQPYSFFYYEDQYFSTSLIASDKIVQVPDRWTFDALLFIERACQYLINCGCRVQVGDVSSSDQLHTMRYGRGLRMMQFNARDGVITANFIEGTSVSTISLNNGTFYKNGVDANGYTTPDANLELWMQCVCKWLDWVTHLDHGRARRKLDTTELVLPNQPLALKPCHILANVNSVLTKELFLDLGSYLSANSKSHSIFENECTYERHLPMGYKTEVSISRAAEEINFSCTIQVHHRSRADPFYMEFGIENKHFVFLHQDQSSMMEQVEWLRGLFLSVVRAWTHPAQLIAYGLRSNKKNTAIKLSRRYIQVEKEFVTCTICEDRPIDSSYTSCGHCLCSECAGKLQKICPICKTKVTGNLKLFI